jgi:small subunit ribosomal protein S1
LLVILLLSARNANYLGETSPNFRPAAAFDKNSLSLYTAAIFNSSIFGWKKPIMELSRQTRRLSFLIMEASKQTFAQLLEEKSFLNIPKIGDIIKGNIVSISKNEVKIDIPGFRTGVVRGPELKDESGMYETLKAGDEVEATVVGTENEHGDMELSFRFAGHLRAWETLREMMQKREKISVRILEANKGGMLVHVNHIQGFLPVSQLSPDHYPRVSGGEKNKILEKLRTYVGTDFIVQVIDVNEQEGKLIVSEKSIWEDEQKEVLAKFKVGDEVEGDVVALADFGAFIRFDGLEGLAHISELAWQRIDHPRDILTMGQKVKAQIINVEGSKIFLSLKRMVDDPWKNVTDKYRIGQIVRGKIIKANPFGFFVELDNDIHGLAHVSELSSKPIKEPTEAANIGDDLAWKIVSIEPEQHRLGLSLKAMEESKEEGK